MLGTESEDRVATQSRWPRRLSGRHPHRGRARRVVYAGATARGSAGGSRRVLPERSSASLRALLREDATARRQQQRRRNRRQRWPCPLESARERVLGRVLAVLGGAVGRVGGGRALAAPPAVGRGGVLVGVAPGVALGRPARRAADHELARVR